MGSKHAKEESVFKAALAIDDPAGRAAYLDEACGDDAELRAAVEALLKAHQQAGNFLETPAIEMEITSGGEPLAEGPGTVIGRYKLLERIGEGGFGVVYMAQQQEPIRRKVALKIIKLGMDTKQVIARFEAERQALAMMDHPNIAKVLDAGATDSGRPYFVMELVRGIPITEYCDKNSLPTRQRLELFIDVCHALQHAHQKAIIHRDVKPTNVLVTLHDGRPVPKVIDFGVAKALGRPLTEKTVFTEFRQFIGTPEYMSPEQARLGGLDLDTRCDIYALGVLLYELLTGATPFEPKQLREAGYGEILRIIRETDPPKPSTRVSTLGEAVTEVAAHRQVEPGALGRLLRGDLDWIVMRALEKDRARRYETANALAEDIQRHLNDEPVLAGPPGVAYRTRKFVRRHRRAVAAGALVAAALLVGLAAATVGFVQASRERDRAEVAAAGERQAAEEAKKRRKEADEERKAAQRSESMTRRHLYAAHMNAAQQAWDSGHTERVLELLDAHIPEPGRDDLRRFEWYYLWRLCHPARFILSHVGTVHVAFSPDGKTSATVANDGTVRLWDPRTGRRLAILNGHTRRLWSVAFSPDGRTLASGSEGDAGEVVLWDVATRKPRARLEGHRWCILDIAFSPDGKRLATAGGDYNGKRKVGVIKLWESAAGREVATLTGHTRGVASVAFAPDGRTLASGGFDGTARLWDARTGQERACVKLATHVHGVAFSPDGKLLATTTGSCVNLRDPATLEVQATLRPPEKRSVFSAGFSPDGRILAAAGTSTGVRLWDVKTGQEWGLLRGHTHWVWSVAFAPDGKILASGSRDGTARIWDLADASQAECAEVDAPWRGRGKFAFSPDGKTLAIPGHDGAIRLWDMLARQERARLTAGAGPINAVAFSPDGKTLAAAGGSKSQPGEVTLWDPATGQQSGRLGRPGAYRYLAFSPDGRTLAVGSRKSVELWDVATRRRKGPARSGPTFFTCLAVSPDGRTIAAASRESGGDDPVIPGQVQLWDARAMEAKATLRWPELLDVLCAAFSPDGETLVAGGGSRFNPLGVGAVAVLDLRDRAQASTLQGHLSLVNAATFSPDGGTLATASQDGTVKLWDTTIWQQRACFKWEGEVDSLVFSPSGATLAAGDVAGGKIVLWQAATQRDVADRAREIAASRAGPWAMQASESFWMGQWEQGLAHNAKAIALNPEEWFTWNLRGRVHRALGQPEQSLGDFSRAIELNPGCFVPWRNRAKTYGALGRPEEAMADITKALELASEGRARWATRGRLHVELGLSLEAAGELAQAQQQYRKAVAIFSERIKLRPSDWDLWVNLGLARGKLASSLRASGRATEARKEDENADRALLRALELAGKPAADVPDEAASRKALESCAVRLNSWAWELATCADPKRRDPARAVRLAKKAVEAAPKKEFIWNTLGAAHYRAGDWKAAIAALQKCMALRSGGDSNDFFFLAMAHWQLGNKDQARKWYDRAVEWMEKNKPRHAELLRFRAEAEALLGATTKPASRPAAKEVTPGKKQ